MRKLKERTLQEMGFYIFMVSPALLSYLIIIAYPIVFSTILGFTEYNLFKPDKMKFIGLANYIRLARHPVFWRALGNNIIVVLVSVFGQIPLGIILAYLLYRKAVKGVNFFQAMVFLPIAISTIVIGILWRTIFSPYGLGTQLLRMAKQDPGAMFIWSKNPRLAMLPIVFVLLWMYTGFYMVYFLANLQKFEKSVLESAQIEGASEFQIFFWIILPHLRGVILISMILAIAGSLKSFDLVWAMTRGGPANYTSLLAIYMYKYAFFTHNKDAYSYGSAVATVIIAISVALILLTGFINSRIRGKEE